MITKQCVLVVSQIDKIIGILDLATSGDLEKNGNAVTRRIYSRPQSLYGRGSETDGAS